MSEVVTNILLVFSVLIVITTILLVYLFTRQKTTEVNISLMQTDIDVRTSAISTPTDFRITYPTGLGTFCDSNNECADNLICDGICRVPENGLCRIGSDCYGNLICDNGICKQEKINKCPCDPSTSICIDRECKLLGENKCLNNSECVSNVCDGGFCKQLSIGDKCDDNNKCTPPFICNTNGLCSFPILKACKDSYDCVGDERCIFTNRGYSACILSTNNYPASKTNNILGSYGDRCRPTLNTETVGQRAICQNYMTCVPYGASANYSCSYNTQKDIFNYGVPLKCMPGTVKASGIDICYAVSGLPAILPNEQWKNNNYYNVFIISSINGNFNKLNINFNSRTNLSNPIHIGEISELNTTSGTISAYVFVFDSIIFIYAYDNTGIRNPITISTSTGKIESASTAPNVEYIENDDNKTTNATSTGYLCVHFNKKNYLIIEKTWEIGKSYQLESISKQQISNTDDNPSISLASNLTGAFCKNDTSKKLIKIKSTLYKLSNDITEIDNVKSNKSFDFNYLYCNKLIASRIGSSNNENDILLSVTKGYGSPNPVVYPASPSWTKNISYPYRYDTNPVQAVPHEAIYSNRNIISMSYILVNGNIGTICLLSQDIDTQENLNRRQYLEYLKFEIDTGRVFPSVISSSSLITSYESSGVGLMTNGDVIHLTKILSS